MSAVPFWNRTCTLADTFCTPRLPDPLPDQTAFPLPSCTNADKRRAVLTLLKDKTWAKWSDREISRRCKVDHVFVGKMRAELTGDNTSEPRTYTTRHGTVATRDDAQGGPGRPVRLPAGKPETVGFGTQGP
jgi:hypothetical protein